MFGIRHKATGPIGEVLWNYDPTGHAMVGHWTQPTTVAGVTAFGELATTWMPTLAGGDANVPVFHARAYGW